ncbi:MAG: DUF2461 domain-containing protein [Tenacibaculum sp.]
MVFENNSLQFLKDLKQNNNREWFADNKNKLIKAQENFKAFFLTVKAKLEEKDEIDKVKLYRIYRDLRFSKDKSPYQPHFAVSFSRKGAHLRGGYYLRIRPEESFLAGGFWEPNKQDLYRIRKEFEFNDSDIKAILSEKKFVKHFGGKLMGEELKTAPKGFDKEHPAIYLIKKKAFIAKKNFLDKEVLSKSFIDEVNASFLALRPYFDYMSRVLTTNINGESII